MTRSLDWRDTFCGRRQELDTLERLFIEVANGKGPKLAVVLGDRGMGKTRLVQELYRRLSNQHDPQNYWPDAALFDGNNLRPAPELSDPQVRQHFESFTLRDRPLPFLWWGFRLHDPKERNAASGDLNAHRRTLEPHIAPMAYARDIAGAKDEAKKAGLNIVAAIGKDLAKEVIKQIPAIGTVLEKAIDYHDKVQALGEAGHRLHRLWKDRESQTMPGATERRLVDLQERTLQELAVLLSPSKGLAPVPAVVFCDDAQFATEDNDEGAFRLILELWERAHLSQWPLLLVLSHWGVEWRQRAVQRSDLPASLAREMARAAASPQFGCVIDLPKESTLADLTRAGLPDLPPEDVRLLLDKADGNPQVLIELVTLVRPLAAWRTPTGALTAHARREIEQRSTNLRDLILQRLNSEVTPGEVRRAAALASLQGMEFLCQLTVATGEALGLPATVEGLQGAQNPHRLVVNVKDDVAGFLQRAFHEAARELVSLHLGDPAAVKQALLDASVAITQNPDRLAGLSRAEQQAAWTVVAKLGAESPDATLRQHSGIALLQLTAIAMTGQRGSDYARAAACAARFEDGLGSTWNLEGLPVSLVRSAADALEHRYGNARPQRLANALLNALRSRVTREPTPEVQRDLTLAIRQVGRVALAKGELPKADELFRERLQLSRELTKIDGTDRSCADLVSALLDLGHVAERERKFHEAASSFREALDLSRELAARSSSPDAQYNVSYPLDDLGRVAEAIGDLVGARSFFEEALAIRQEWATQRDEPEVQLNLTASLDNLGRIAMAQRRWEDAFAFFQEGLATRKAVSERAETTRFQQALAVSFENVGKAAEKQRHWSSSASHFQSGVDLARRLVEVVGTPDAKHDLLVALSNLARVRAMQKEWDIVEKLQLESQSLARDLVVALGTPEARRDLAMTCKEFARLAMMRGQTDRAGTLFNEALAILRQLASNDDGSPQAWADLSALLDDMAHMAFTNKQWTQAENILKEGIEIDRRLASRYGNLVDQRRVWVSLCNLGRVAKAQSRLPEAEAHFRSALTLARKLFASGPSTDAQQTLVSSLDLLLNLLASKTDSQEANSLYSERLSLLREWVAEHGAVWARHELATMLLRTAEGGFAHGQAQDACQMLDEALQQFEWLVRETNHDYARGELSTALALHRQWCQSPN